MSLLKTLEKNWPVDYRERCKSMFNKEILSDVKFVVQAAEASQKYGEHNSKRSRMEIPAHKFYLSVCSPVFYAMFCGEMAETKEHIDLPDCEYEGMLELLRYIYTDEVCLNGDNVMQVLYLAEKYMIAGLAKECTEYLGKNLDLSNVLCVFKHGEQYGKEELLSHCWLMIDENTEEALKSNEFLSMDRSFLNQLVERDSLNIREVELFKAADCWAKEECKRQQLEANGPLKRQVLGENIVKKIRFPIMKEEEFEDVVPSNILTTEETREMSKYFSSKLPSPVIGFSDVYRVGSLLRCCTFKSFITSTCIPNRLHENDPEEETWMPLNVDREIMLHGVSILGIEGGEYTVTLRVTRYDEEDEDSICTTKTGTYTSVLKSCDIGFYYGFNVIFDEPIVFEAGENHYVTDAWLVGPVRNRCLGNDEFVDVVHSGVKIHFFHADQIDHTIHGTLHRCPLAEILFTLRPDLERNRKTVSL